MTIGQLKTSVRRLRPVLIMLQAWGTIGDTEEPRKSCKRIWRDGHWVVAIGYDEKGVASGGRDMAVVPVGLGDRSCQCSGVAAHCL
jgi:hypothetical protein